MVSDVLREVWVRELHHVQIIRLREIRPLLWLIHNQPANQRCDAARPGCPVFHGQLRFCAGIFVFSWFHHVAILERRFSNVVGKTQ